MDKIEKITKDDEQSQSKDILADNICLTRDLVSEPSNTLNPESYADLCKTFKKDGATSKIKGAKFKSLFAKANKSSKKVSKNYIKSKNKDLASRKYGQGQVKEQNINDLFNNIKKINATNSSSKKYDKYYSKIVKIMTNEWNSYIKMNGNYKVLLFYMMIEYHFYLYLSILPLYNFHSF